MEPPLDLRTRSLLTCAALAVMGRQRGIEAHFRGALNIGIIARELIAMLKQMGLYAGFATSTMRFGFSGTSSISAPPRRDDTGLAALLSINVQRADPMGKSLVRIRSGGCI